MNVLQEHHILPLQIRPGDVINVIYHEEVRSNTGVIGYKPHKLVAHNFTQPEVIDTILVVKVHNQLGLRTGTGVFFGEAET